LERRQRLKPVLCPARQHNLVVGEMLLSMVWAALAACVIGAVIYDIASWLGG
jgi:hypothetical protein